MSNVVIVAIPKQDDYVWKISSEKKPHMTLCFLGDSAPLLPIYEFVAHAVETMRLGPFMLDVDFRGVLGPDEADVLFFRKDWSIKRIAEFRTQLLKDNTIRTAYESVTQYPMWTPHLTLGYPETPANEDNRDFPGINWVDFDKIAVWDGDFEGPEIQLEHNFDDAMEVSMSVQAGEEFIRHYGVKGMKWGVRNKRPAPAARATTATSVVSRNRLAKTRVKAGGGQNHPATDDAIKAALAKQKLKKSGHAALSNTELQELALRLDLETRVEQLIKRAPKTPVEAVKAHVKEEFKKDPVGTTKKGVKIAKDTPRVASNVHRVIKKGRARR